MAPSDSPSTPIPAAAWKALGAAGAGWMLDAMDVMLFALAVASTEFRNEFQRDMSQVGRVFSTTLLAAAVGGVLSGFLADRFGRVRMLMVSILIYSVFTGLTATAHSMTMLFVWRALVGLGLGGVWSAGSVLVAESWPARHRGKAVGLMQSGWALGYILAALLAMLIPAWGWRPLFVIGVAPALLLVWIRKYVPEPELWDRHAAPDRSILHALPVLLRRPHVGRVVLATSIAAALLAAYWGLFSWIPTYLASPDRGGAGLGIIKSAWWIVPMNIGAFFGYTTFGLLADRIGRRPTFIAFVLGAAVLVPIYAYSARSEMTLMVLGPLLGFFGQGYFSLFGAMLAELFPSQVRGAAQGLCFNTGRAAAAVAPWAIGSLAEHYGLALALAAVAVCYVVGAVLVMLLPETRGQNME